MCWKRFIVLYIYIYIFFFFFFIDIDECTSLGDNDCGSNALCTNTNGSYSCNCKDGFQGDGINCTGKECSLKMNIIWIVLFG